MFKNMGVTAKFLMAITLAGLTWFLLTSIVIKPITEVADRLGNSSVNLAGSETNKAQEAARAGEGNYSSPQVSASATRQPASTEEMAGFKEEESTWEKNPVSKNNSFAPQEVMTLDEDDF